ncbi:anti-sigma factor [Roseivivax isoporae]|uniref:Anti-sigma K factor RskA C-terminal domain-containing protein n=1 Tax=Roseivivax isoporae LMG 25204 TaxID=1449351 RepID=X7FBU9_9RHOB|nr:anti-sigma factor [Roseivivax isoporae]ETX30218.1 hypothetical protein RISW2_17890 [Roseivivax isoporae LMG 25204]
MQDTADPPDPAAPAAEYVLRLLGPQEHAAFEQRMERDPTLRDAVRRWTEWLVPLTDAVPPQKPARRVRRRLMARLFSDGHDAGLWHRAAPWRGLTIAALAAAGFLAWEGRRPPPAPALLADLVAAGHGLHLVALRPPRGEDLRLLVLSGSPPASGTLELWLLAEGAPPVALGLLDGPGEHRLALPGDLAAAAGPLALAVSAEPEGGSPTGLPTGPVLASAEFAPI